MNEWLEREELLIGSENIEKLNKSTVAVFGCGGVGSYALEALVRAGVGNIVLIDKDIVDITNINRQLIADTTTVGQDKVEVAKQRALRINPNINIEIHKCYQMTRLLHRQRTRYQVRPIPYLLHDFLHTPDVFFRYASTVMNHSVHRTNRHIRQAGNVSKTYVFIFLHTTSKEYVCADTHLLKKKTRYRAHFNKKYS